MATIRVDVVTAERRVYQGDADFVVVPGEMGELGILPRHTPLLTRIKLGEIRVKRGEETDYIFVNGGILEVQPDQVTVLADTAERAEDIDEALAVEAQRRAEELREKVASDMDVAHAEAALQEALTRLKVLRRRAHRA
ncbi:MAG: F0F1 ATP synthase subunit epsilon [Alphaproteobacteria bacterium CG_4_10_14_0_2_um_filter_63_37]|nr:MAG: F0F1 ATP synthase subunit epsilon [Proteobacteria bacterium CG1_02_64_396]PJA25904.1 MAG: F0F1 ATP synthase subunit epsilon [Alphaproteobacteria bacterium CG_4_10_14_0_2_um_filter_63_37]